VDTKCNLYMGTKINQSETTLLYNGIPLNFKVEKIYIVITYNNGHVLVYAQNRSTIRWYW